MCIRDSHVIFPLITPLNQLLFSFSYHCQVNRMQQFLWQGNPKFSRYGLHDNHGLRSSASPVLTATGFVNGRWQFSTPHGIHTDHQKICCCAKFGANPSTGDFWADAKWVSLPPRLLKKFEFHKSKMADGRHFKNRCIILSP